MSHGNIRTVEWVVVVVVVLLLFFVCLLLFFCCCCFLLFLFVVVVAAAAIVMAAVQLSSPTPPQLLSYPSSEKSLYLTSPQEKLKCVWPYLASRTLRQSRLFGSTSRQWTSLLQVGGGLGRGGGVQGRWWGSGR